MPASSSPALIAFYGLLMRTGRAQQRLRLGSGLRYVRPCRIPGRLLDLGSYPGLIEGPGTVRGELFEILDSRMLSALDRFEDYDPSRPRRSEYLRRMRTLAEPRVDAWVYLYNRSLRPASSIPSGDWHAHISASAGRPSSGRPPGYRPR